MALLRGTIDQVLIYLEAANQELRNQQTEKAVVLLCKAYALEPGMVKEQVTNLPQHSLNIVLSTLEDWCVCSTEAGDLLQRAGIALSLDDICDLITSPGLRPNSVVAWSSMLRLKLQRKSYLDVVATASEALKVCSHQKDEIVFLLQRSVAYLLLNERKHAVKDLISAFDKDREASLACVKESQAKFLTAIMEALYKTSAKFGRNVQSFSDEERTLLVKLDRIIVSLNPRDLVTLGDCADHMIKLKQFRQAVSIVSDGLNLVGSAGKWGSESLQLLLQRAHCYLALEETEQALNDYARAVSIDGELTRISILSMPQHHQGNIVALAKHHASELLTHCRIKAKLMTSCSVDTRITTPNFHKAALLYRLLYLLDGNNIDALLNSAECLKLQNKYAEAISTLDLVLALRPKSCKAHYTRALCYMRTNEMSSALADFNASLAIQASFVQALCGRAFVWLMSGKLNNAVTDLSSASRISMAATASWISELSDQEQENLKLQLKEYFVTTTDKRYQNEASVENTSLIRIGDVLTRAFATDVECHLAFVDVLHSFCKFDEAQAILVRLIKHKPDDYSARLHLAALKMRRGGNADALEDICALLKTVGEEKLAGLVSKLTEDDRARITREGHREGVQRSNTCPRDTSAEEYFTVAIAASPNNSFESYLWRAKIQFQKGDPDLALRDYDRILQLKPRCVEALCWRGLLHTTKKKLRESYHDLLRALRLSASTLKTFILSLSENNKQLLLETLEDCAQLLFSHYVSRGFRSKYIIILCHLLVEIDGKSVSYHSMYADGLIIFEDYQKAAKELDIAEGLCANDTSVFSRSGLVRMKLNEIEISASQFKRVADIDTEALQFVITALNPSQKRSLSREAIARANDFTGAGLNEQALGYFTLAVVATDGKALEILRMRSRCFERLGRFQQAIDDMTSVVTSGAALACDICARANLHLLNENEKEACLDFVVAMETDEIATVNFISSSCLGKSGLIKVFVRVATADLNCKRFSDGLLISTSGLKIDHGNTELKNLKRKFEFGVTNKCFIQ